jgi:CheY-like chemotaxis protein
MLTSELFFQHLRSALNHLYDPYYLRRSPLVKEFNLGDQPDAASNLQHILNQTIEKMEPKPGESSYTQRRRNYELITYRYVQQFNQEEVSAQLGLSVRHLRREQNAAIYDLAARLWDEYHLGTRPFQVSLQELDENPLLETPPPAQEGLNWLSESSDTEPANLAQVLADVTELTQPLATRFQARIELQSEPALPEVEIPQVALRQLLLNCFSVAMRGKPGKTIRILARRGETQVEIECGWETGEAGPRELGEDEKTSLDMAARIAKAYKGTLTYAWDQAAIQARIGLPIFHHHTLLVIDDNRDFIQLVERFLTGTRYKTAAERDPHQALASAERLQAELILLDVMMPNVDGWEVLGRLRRNPPTAEIPVIICSILPQEDLALSLGASGFLRKPLTQAALLAALDPLLANLA